MYGFSDCHTPDLWKPDKKNIIKSQSAT